MSTGTVSTSFRSRIFRAGSWTLLGHAFGQVLRLGSNLVMTRLLVPEMFGVMALATVVLVGLQLFSDIGLGQSVVQSRRGNDPIYLNTVWVTQIARGTVIWLLGLVSAFFLYAAGEAHLLPIHSAYASPILPSVIAVLCLNALIGGFASTKLATSSRNLDIGRITLIELGTQLGAIILMVAWTVWDRSIWALVAGSLFSSTLRTSLSHLFLAGERNRLQFDKTAFREILGFGKWVFLSSILGFLSASGDRLMLAGLIDSATLGIYAIAFFMVSALQEVFARLAGNVGFPAFSQVVRNRASELKETYYKFRLPVDIASLLVGGVLLSAGHLLIQLLYDDRYSGAGHMVEILCISLFEIRFAFAGQCFMAMGKPKLLSPIIVIRMIALFLLLPWAYGIWGLDGALWVAGGSVLFTMPITIYLKIKFDIFNLKRELVVLPLIGVGYLFGVFLTKAIQL